MVGMSQDRLGQMVGLTFQQIQKYEKGANRIGASRLYQFATLLDVPPAYFFEGLEGQPVTARDGRTLSVAVPAGSPAASITREDVELLRAFRGLQQQGLRRRIIDLVWAMNGDSEAAEPAASPETLPAA
ncbi:helix-turn-helix domain-containing protein [Ferrovibrio terrae]|uniref:Helix-turn-helix domain-containing protein n=2 Tax=Ferrovibrio terrae TaxID=2594003 RepID=A0A516H7D5_9PROT|nr:helix-turn-helix domain-containing protein [Ferrovibrio terrae]